MSTYIRTSHAIGICVVLLCITLFVVRELRALPNGNVHVWMLDVGQGDALFVLGPHGEQILVDGGPSTATLEKMSAHMSLFDRTIDLLILTHPHLDHLASFPEILRRYTVGAVMITGAESHTGKYEEMLSILRELHVPVLLADPEQDLLIGTNLLLDIVWPPTEFAMGNTWKDLNDTSIVFKLIYGEDSLLFTGDMETLSENLLLASGADVDVDILKVGHHGSRGSTSTGFLLAVSPEHAIISAGEGNSYKHPHIELIERLKRFHIPYKATLWDGEIAVKMDGIDN